MFSRIFIGLVVPPVVTLAVVVIGAANALQLALAPAFEEIAVCTQWNPRRD